jgi:hypothetical protein
MARSMPAVSISPAIVVVGTPAIVWPSATRTSFTWRASSWNACAPIEPDRAEAPSGNGADSQPAPSLIQARPPRATNCMLISVPFGPSAAFIVKAAPAFETAPSKLIVNGSPSATTAMLPSNVAELRAACACSARRSSSCARCPSWVLQPERSRAAPTSVARSRVTQPQSAGRASRLIPQLVGSAAWTRR